MGNLPARRILVAEDSPTQAAHLQDMLETEGFEVACVPDAQAALALMVEESFDLVLTDVMMPGVLDGIGLLRALRSDPASESVPVMLLSAQAEEDVRIEGLSAGADDYIVKPFAARELLARIDAAIRLARLRRGAASREQERKTAEVQAKLRLAMEAASMGEVILHLRSGAVVHTPGFATLLGFPAYQLLTLENICGRHHPDDRADALGVRAVEHGEGDAFEAEHRLVLPDGSERWLAARGRVIRDAADRPLEIASVYVDITERKLAEERQLLLDELNHRVKNTLATVQAIAQQTRRHTATADEFSEAFEGRLAALASAHDLLSLNVWVGATLEEVLHRTLGPYGGTGEASARIVLRGGKVRLSPNAAVTLNMAFHELATNSAKYGSLSAAAGTVEVSWSIDRSAASRRVDILWRESGGPPVSPPSRRGFGTRLVQQGLGRELDGEVELDYAPAGLCCRIRLPESPKVSSA